LFFAIELEDIRKLLPAGSLRESLTIADFVPIEDILNCIERPTLLETAVELPLTKILDKFALEVVVAK
jgi:hypothetical protein